MVGRSLLLVVVILCACGATAQEKPSCLESARKSFSFPAPLRAFVLSDTVELIGVGLVSGLDARFDLGPDTELVAEHAPLDLDAGSGPERRVLLRLVVPRSRAGVIVSEGGLGLGCVFPGNAQGLAGPLYVVTVDAATGWALSVRDKKTGKTLLSW